MRKVILFIAMSLDGYIADAKGNVDWLNGQDGGGDTNDTYSMFIKEIDTVVIGWNTYYQITTKLSPAEWVYADLTSYVITHRNLSSTDNIIFTGEDPCSLVSRLKCGQGKDIWICGGADIIRQLLKADLIDEYDISVIPTILGAGIRLFESTPDQIKLELVDTRSNHGIVELVYTRRQDCS